ncbi:DNA polymerase III subunit delta' C-terminal domain-containing protein [Buchnera aphidicola (Takecallis taiwana)]|uniref:DNA polymerase III subunit delta' C-terminal domain-containing protein n=1 Tax=Buchnera aphidicola TaxID=9 RepID=UPI0031B6D984
MQNTWYPWLNKTYKNIIQNYQNGKLHHTILIESYSINNTYKIIWAIIRWILCHKKHGIKNCGKCIGCTLIKNNIHPDCYIIHAKNTNNIIEIKKIRHIIDMIKNTAQQKHDKILWIPDYSLLTIFGINALLKIIEEPPENTFFFIGNKFYNNIHSTFRSRCILYKIFTPNEKIGLSWMQKNTTIKKKTCLLALRINNNDPELANKLLKNKNWIQRIQLYNNIHYAINKNNFLTLLPYLNTDDIINKIYWIILLFLDSMKLQKKIFSYLINIDQIPLITQISQNYSYITLNNIVHSWVQCRYLLTTVNNINYELLILNQLLKWQILKKKS